MALLTMRRLLLIFFTAMLIGPGPQVLAAGARVSVTEAWIRWLPGGLPAGGYLTLHNDGDEPVRLTGVTSASYGMTMLHRSRLEGSVSRMEPVGEIVLSPHQTLTFASGGYHIMLEQPVHPVQPGDRVTLTLHFADGSSLDAICTVRKPAGGGE
jgi:hypothetical protein